MKCRIDGCLNKAIANGLCAMHYMRARRTGDPSVKSKAGRKPGPRPVVLGAAEAEELASLRAEVASLRQQNAELRAARESKPSTAPELKEEIARQVEKEMPRYRQSYAQAEEINAAHDGVFAAKDYRLILACLHPDDSATPERRSKAFKLVSAAEKILKKPEPKPLAPGLPKTVAELVARKAAARAAAKAKRKRAAKGGKTMRFIPPATPP